MTTEKITFSVRIHREVAEQFDQKIKDKYGKTRSYKAEVVEQLLQDYLDQDQQQQINEETQQQIQRLQQQVQMLEAEKQQLEDQLEQSEKDNKDVHQRLTEAKETNKKLDKEKTKWSNDYRHQVEVHQKLQEEHDQLQNENKRYVYLFGAVSKMSWWERLLGNYPEEIKELQPPTKD